MQPERALPAMWRPLVLLVDQYPRDSQPPTRSRPRVVLPLQDEQVRADPQRAAFDGLRRGRGCFPLCEKCWAALTPKQRLPFYDQLVNEWIRQTPNEVAQYERDRNAIRKAVLAGG